MAIGLPHLPLRVLLLLALFAAGSAWPALSPKDHETLALEGMVADDPRAAMRQVEQWEAQAKTGADKALQLKAMRLKIMALTQLELVGDIAALTNPGIQLAQELRDVQAECEFLNAKAAALSADGKHGDALKVLDQSKIVAEKNNLARAAIATQIGRSVIVRLQGRDSDALDLLLRARQQYGDIGDEQGARDVLSAIANAYDSGRSTREDLLKALDFLQRSIGPNDEKSRRHDLSTTYFNIGALYQRLKDVANAKLYFQKSMVLYQQLDDQVGLAFGNHRLGQLAGDAGSWREALAYQDRALPVIGNAGDITMIFNLHRSRAIALVELDRRRESLEALALADETRKRADPKSMDVSYWKAAARIYARLGDYEKAYRAQVELRDAEEWRAKEARDNEAREIKTRFEVKEKEAENALLRARDKESEARRLALVLAVILLLFVLGGLGWYLFRQGQQNRRFANLAMRDELTSLPNRRSILAFAQKQLRIARQEKQNFCLALVDLDHFKTINDEFGHAVGDAVLTEFAAIGALQLRSIDRLGRYGGEEFMLVMPGSEIAQIPQVFTRLRVAIRQLRIAGMPADHQLTFSMGASTVMPHDDVDTMTKRADDALYRAKQGGRDRYEMG